MQKLGYVYNRAAANLRSGRSRTIGLLVTDITNPFFAELAVSIETQLSDANYAVLLSNTMDERDKQERLLRLIHGYQVDGILLCPAEDTAIETLDTLESWKMPFALIARYLADCESDYAGADNRTGAELAIEHLHERGHRNIAFLGGKPHSSARQERFAGFSQKAAALDLETDSIHSVTSPVSREGGFDAMLSLLNQPNPPTAALCYNDVVAFGALHALQSKNLHPGRDFGIVGFDNIADAALVRPALTTVSIAPSEIGNAAIELLLDRIEEPDRAPRKVILPPKLVVRESS